MGGGLAVEFARHVSGSVVVFALTIGTAVAADLGRRNRLPDDYVNDKPVWYPWNDPKPISRWEVEIGGRYFYVQASYQFGEVRSSLLEGR